MSNDFDRGAIAIVIALMGAVCIAGFAPTAGADMLPSRSACAGQQNPNAPEPQQEHALKCLIEHVRQSAGAGTLHANRALERAAGKKAGDVAHCGFSHTACGRAADAWAKHFGYQSGASSWAWGENLAWGKGRHGTPRRVVKAWLASPPHHETMLRGSFEDIGIGLRHTGNRGVWVLQLGCHGC